MPNRRMVALADTLLALDGRLLQARDDDLYYPDYAADH
jgi:predicted protein tyrosine phosphatase